MILFYVEILNSQVTNATRSSDSGLSADILNEPSCFLGSAEEVDNKLTELITHYENFCGVSGRKEISDLAKFAQILGKLEVQKKQGKIIDADLDVAVKLSADYSSIGSIKTANDLNIDNLMEKFHDEITDYVHKNDLPTYFIDSIWRLIKFNRYSQLMVLYTNKKVCMNTTPIDLKIVEDITSDPHEQQISCQTKLSDEFKIDPLDFEEDGLALAFWVIEDATLARDLTKNVAQGYVNNTRVYDLSYFQGSEFGVLVNRFNFSGIIKEVISNSKCSGFLFVLMAFEKDCDHYRLDLTVRLPRENLRSFFQIKLTPDVVENLKINFIKPPIASNPKIYKHFTYSRKQEDQIIVQTAGNVFTKIALLNTVCSQIPNCKYFSTETNKCEKCEKGTDLHEGKCVETCPDKTYSSEGECKPCQNKCETCKTSEDCEKCKEPFHLLKLDANSNKASCVPECPSGMILDEKYNECVPCTENCASCKNLKDCNVCKPELFLLDGKCVTKCPDGTFVVNNPNECKSCAVGCAKCDSLLKCEECKEEFFLKDGVCVKNCGKDHFANEKDKICEPCNEHCKYCENSKECKVCEDGFNLDNDTKTCVNECKPTQTLYDGVCISCGDKKNCDECDPKNIQVCKKCLSPKLLQDNKCVDACNDGYYANDKGECVPCTTECKTCTKDKCIVCNDNNYLIDDKNCISNCPDGYIISGKTCIKCNDKTHCKKCTEKNLEICTECYTPDVLKEGKCEKECGNNYFLKDGECVKCDLGCNICKDKFTCEECDVGYLKKGNVCVKDCGDGYVAINGVCNKCTVENCIVCPADNLGHCTECNPPTVLYGNKCHEKCPVETYEIKEEGKCHDCPKDCLECKDGKTCEKCKSPKVLQGVECKTLCDDGYNNVNGVCQPCESKDCKNCDDTLKSCTDCYSNNFLYNKTCVNPCPDGTYENGKECSPCDQRCQKCQGASSQCTLCIDGFVLNKNGTCTDNCPTGTVKLDNKTCTDCLDEGCDKCNQNDTTECIKCNSTMVLLNGDCFKECPKGFFDLNGECKPCVEGCQSCKSQLSCETCEKPLLLKNDNSCVKDCGEGWINVDGKCRQCKGNCVECLPEDLNHCTKCPEGLLLLDSKCVNECPSKFWQDTYTCEPCIVKDCLKCSTQGKICETCVPPLVLDDNKCTTGCPDGKVEQNGKCVPCGVVKCKTCPSTGTDTCKECIDPFVLVDEFTCGNKCPNGMYADKENRSCKKCTEHCVDCDNSSTCSKCQTGFYLENGVCVENCKEGSRIDIDRCTPCDEKYCQKCTEKDCLVCQPPHVLLNNQCVDSCPDNHFYLEKNNELNAPTCKPCENYCKKCENGKTCIECDKPKILDSEGKCVDNCKDGYVEIEGKCVPCKAGNDCKKCAEKDLTECIDCKDKFYLQNKQCVPDCGEGNYAENNRCNKCIDNCRICHNDKVCDLCKDKFYLLDKICVEECPCGTYDLEGKCINCPDPNCEECTSEECKKCDANYYLENGVCKKECSPGNYKFNFVSCKPCEDHCISCSDKNDCKLCQEGYYLKNGACVQDCGSGYVASESQCKPCDSGCDVCSENNPKKCINCHDKKFLYMEKCEEVCPNGFYNDDSSKSCLPCIENCVLCNNKDSCNQCKDKYLYQSSINKCVTECLDGYRPDKSLCSPCQVDNCKKCDTNVEKCDKCNSDQFKLDDKCVPNCHEGYYTDLVAKECKLCPAECTECKNATECKKCEEGFFLKDSSCVNNCDDGEVVVDGECKKCETPNCYICLATDLSVCQKCTSNNVLSIDVTKNPPTYKCSDTCDAGFYPNYISGKCEPCVDNCSKCSDSKTCEVCVKGYLLESGLCVETCSKGHVERNGKCLPCEETNCLICDNLTLKGCKKCELPLKLKNEKCVKDCGPAYLSLTIDDMEICQPCTEHCNSCTNDKTCNKCDEGFYLKDGICVPDCGDNFVVAENSKCKQCTQLECKKCSVNNLSKCEECVKPNFLTPEQTCVPKCGDKNFERLFPSPACIPCTVSNCLVCDPENFCKKCSSPFVVFNTKCVTNCPDGYYVDKQNTCQPCSDNKCAVCSSENPEKCNKCDKGFFLYNQKCIPDCPDGTFGSDQGECQPCEVHCDICKNAVSCVVCTKPFLLNKNKHCTDSCEKGFVEVKDNCEPCQDKDCDKCDSKDTTKCLVCNSKLFLFKGDCVEVCPSGTVPIGKTCVECEENCKKCTDANTCVDCNQPFIEDNADCVKTCKTGYVAVDGHCTACADIDKCEKCKSDLKTCEKCRTTLLNDDGKCVETCGDGFFYDTKLQKCEKCTEKCSVCDNDQTCKKCTNPSLLNPIDNKCVEVCPDKFTPVVKDQKCEPCTNQNCLKCDVHNPNSCTECPDKTYIIPKNKNENDCINKCPDGFYPSNDGKCNPCDPKCATCTDDKTCQTCNNPFVLISNMCESDCPKGSVNRNGVCFKCSDPKCEVCNQLDLNKCLKCEKRIEFNNLCIDKCPDGYRLDTTTNSCVKCPEHCAKCDENGCTACEDKFYFMENTKNCVNCVQPNLIVNQICTTCKVPGCQECEHTSETCKVCVSNLILFNGSCIASCPEGYYKDGITCKQCVEGCNLCSEQKCTHCNKDLVLINDKCEKECPEGFADVDGVCQPCSKKDCLKCSSSVSECEKCKDKFILFNGNCVDFCPDPYYLKIDKCEKCPDSCKKCDANGCHECSSPNKIKGKECVPNCGEKYFDKGIICEPCNDLHCLECSPENNCKKCDNQSYLLLNLNKCDVVCPDGTYPDDSKRECKPCETGCAKCTVDKCEDCKPGFFYNDGKCVTKCPDQFINDKGRCVPCIDKNCLECLPDNPDKCKNCKKDFHIYEEHCLTECPNQTFQKEDKCIKCDPKCATCEDEETCTSCVKPLIFNNKKCDNNCPDGKSAVDGKCVSCADSHCKLCSTDINNCVECLPPFKLFEGVCQPECPKGFFTDPKGNCNRCSVGCETCDNDKTCKVCRPGFFLENNQCVTYCRDDNFGDCSDHKCKECDNACHSCVGPSSSDCVNCNSTFYRDIEKCVPNTGCRDGTFANDATKECTPCRIPLCIECTSATQCKKCAPGLQLQDNKCVFSHQIAPLVPATEVVSTTTYVNLITPIEKVKGIGVSSDEVSFSFWVRVLAPKQDGGDNVIFSVDNYPAYDYSLLVDDKSENCKFVVALKSKVVMATQTVSCSFPNRYEWSFFYITIAHHSKDFDIGIHILSNNKWEDTATKATNIDNVHEVLVKTATFNFGSDPTPDLKELPDAIQIYDFEIMDYVPTEKDILPLTQNTPPFCDYFCTKCEKTCQACVEGLPLQDGRCQANGAFLNHGLNLINGAPLKYNVKDLFSKNFVSNKWAFTTWFYLQDPDFTKKIVIVEFNYLLPNKEYNTITVSYENDKFNVDGNNFDVKLDGNTWYYLMVGISRKYLTFTLIDFKGNKIKKEIKTKDEIEYLWMDYKVIIATNGWTGSVYDSFLYINNHPSDIQIEESKKSLKCPDNCEVCSRDFTCTKCAENFIKQGDGKCVDNTMNNVVNLIQRVDLWDKNTFSAPVNVQSNPVYTISLWLRKKTHSNLPTNNVHTLVSLKTDNGIIPIIQETLMKDSVSKLSFLWVKNSESFTYKFDHEIYDFFHVTITVDTKAKTLKYNVNGPNPINKTDAFPNTITDIILGDLNGEEANMEISLVDKYPNALTDNQIASIKEPIDCNPGCKECNLRSGKCNKCHNDTSGDTCSILLIGFSYSFIYSGTFPTYDKIVQKDNYANNFKNQEFSSGVNSLKYSVFSHLRFFQLISAKEGERKRILSLGNADVSDSVQGRQIIVLDVVFNNGIHEFEWITNSSGQTKSVREKSLSPVSKIWYTLHAGIDVKEKKFSYIIIDKSNEKQYTGELDLPDFPEKLQEYSELRIFGVGDLIDQNYVVPRAQIQNSFFAVNSGFDVNVFEKYINKFNIEADPTCDKNCSLCTYDKTKKVICLSCAPGLNFKNGVCENPPNYGYVVISKNMVTTSTNYDFSSVNQLVSGPTYSFSLFFRVNYFTTGSQDLVTGVFSLQLSVLDKANLFLNFNNLVKIPVTQEQLSKWVNIIVAGDSDNKVCISVANESNASTYTTQCVSTVINKTSLLTVNPGNYQFQFYGLSIANDKISTTIVDWPTLNCSKDCLSCINNSCTSCLFGTDSTGNCNSQTEVLDDKDKNNSRSFPLSQVISSSNRLRSNSYTVEFIFRPTMVGVICTLSLNTVTYFEVYYNDKDGYEIRYNNLNSSLQVTKVAYPNNNLVNTEHYVALVFDKNKLNYLFYNSNSNSVQGSITVNTNDYLVAGATLKFTNSVDRQIKYTDVALNINTIQSKVANNFKLVQNSCLEGSHYQCTVCDKNLDLKSGVCVPLNSNPKLLLINNIVPLSRYNTENSSLKISFTSKSFQSFTFSFWWRLDSLLPTNQGVVKLSLVEKSEAQLLSLFYNNNNSFELSLNWGKSATISKYLISDVFKDEEIYNWSHITIRTDSNSGSIILSMYITKTHRTIEKEIKASSSALAAIPTTGKVLYANLGFSDDQNVSFEISTIWFVENVEFTSDQVNNLRMSKPLGCDSPCKDTCVLGVCKSSDRITTSISAGKEYLLDVSASSLLTLNLFRPLSDSKYIQTFNNYDISVEIDVNAFLNSKYTYNKDVLFVIHKNNDAKYESLMMNSVIPDELSRLYSLSLIHRDGKLVMYTDYIPWTNSVHSYEVPLSGRKLSDFSTVYVSVSFNSNEKSARVLVMADDLMIINDLGKSVVTVPLSNLSLVYNHPSLSKFNVNLYTPTLLADMNANAGDVLSKQFSSNLCANIDKKCSKCVNSDGSPLTTCLKCNDGYSFYNSSCNPNKVSPQ